MKVTIDFLLDCLGLIFNSFLNKLQCAIVKTVLLRCLAHWGWVTHICVSKLNIIGSDNGLSPGRRQAIIWTNTGILLIWPLGTNFSEMLIEIHTFSFNKMHVKMLSAKRRPFCLGLNVLTWGSTYWYDDIFILRWSPVLCTYFCTIKCLEDWCYQTTQELHIYYVFIHIFIKMEFWTTFIKFKTKKTRLLPFSKTTVKRIIWICIFWSIFLLHKNS